MKHKWPSKYTLCLYAVPGPQKDVFPRKLAGVLGMTHYEENLSEAALVDYYVATY